MNGDWVHPLDKSAQETVEALSGPMGRVHPFGEPKGVKPQAEGKLPKDPPYFATRTATEITTRAGNLVGGDRDRQHGSKRDNFARIAAMWNAYLSIRRDRDAPLDATDVGHMMAAMKLARTQSGALNIDDYVDGVGYMACAGEIAQDDQKFVEVAIDAANAA
jgi:hypothetical protein